MRHLKLTSPGMAALCALFLNLATLSGSGQTSSSDGKRFVQPVPESVSLFKSHERLRQGDSIKLAIDVFLLGRNGQEIFFTSNSTDSSPDLSPMLLLLDPQPGFEITPVSYPRADAKLFSFSAKRIATFKGNVPMRFSIRASPSAPLGMHTFTGRLVTQAVDNQRAYTPQSTPLTFTIEVVGPGAQVRRTHDPFVSPVLTPGEAALIPLRILEAILIVLFDCPFNGNCSS